MKAKLAFIATGLIAPCIIYVGTVLTYAYGGYDGKHCAGLLDAVWACSEFEYYLDWLINPFSIIVLFGYLFISAVVTSIIWFMYKKYNKQRQPRPSGWTR